jgi:hypothetical protein
MSPHCSPETSVDFQWTTWCYIPKDRTVHNPSCENLKSYKYDYFARRVVCSAPQLWHSPQVRNVYIFQLEVPMVFLVIIWEFCWSGVIKIVCSCINYNTINLIIYQPIKRNQCVLMCLTCGVVTFSTVWFFDWGLLISFCYQVLISHKLSFPIGFKIFSRLRHWNSSAELLHSTLAPHYSTDMGNEICWLQVFAGCMRKAYQIQFSCSIHPLTVF